MLVRLRKVTKSDKEFAKSTHHQSYRDVVVRQFGEWNENCQDKFFQEKWNYNRMQIILCDEVPVGFLIVENQTDCVFLREIVLRPDSQGKGIGTKIIKEEINRAKTAGLPIRLQVLKKNQAIALYERLQFREYGMTETHILMELRG
jgi:GNAT superfamily N-acetyltransferase